MCPQDDESNNPVSGFTLEEVQAAPQASDLLVDPEAMIGAMARSQASESFLQLLTAGTNYQAFVESVLLTLMRVVKCEASSLLEVDDARQVFRFRASVGQVSDKIKEFTVPFGKGIVGYVAETKVPLIVDDLHQNAVHLKSLSDALGFEARNLIAIPLLIRGRLYGVLEMLNRVGEATFTPADRDLLIAISQSASKAIEIRMMLSKLSQPRKEAA